MSTQHNGYNTLQDYISRYIKQTLDTSHNKYHKLCKELLSKVEEIIKQAVNGTKHQDDGMEIHGQLHSKKKLFHAMAKQHILSFLDAHQVKKEVFEEFDKYSINAGDLRILQEEEGLVNRINNINLSPQNSKNDTLNRRKTLARSIPLKSTTVEKYKDTINSNRVHD